MQDQLRPGDYIGGEYHILKVFGGRGKSGMGVVYLVENRSFYEPFVLKTYQATELGDKYARFLKEAQTWVQLGSHPNIVRCLWVNEIAGALYIAAEYVAPDEDGFSTLEERLRVGNIPLDKQVSWATEFCFAMRHAYRKGLVSHRDLKPANLLLDQGSLKITDFGLSKITGQLDQTVFSGESISANMTRVGVVFGTPPYMAPEQFLDTANVDQRADIYSLGVILYEMATGELPICPERPPKDENEALFLWAVAHHRGNVRSANFPLLHIVQRCLEKNPAKRFQSFDDILVALIKSAEENKVLLPKEQIADSDFDDAYALAMSLAALGKSEEQIAKLVEITRRWPQAPWPFNELGKTLLTQGKYSEAIPWLKRAIEIDESRSAPWNNLGGAHARMGQFEAAEFAYSSAIQVDSENTGAMIGLAQLLMIKNPALALKWCERAYELRPRKLIVLKVGGLVALHAGKHDRAAEFLSDALQLEPNDQQIFFNFALTYRARNMLKQHIDTLETYLKRWPNDPEAYRLLSQGYVDLGKLEAATEVCIRWSKVPDAEVAGTINVAHLLAAQDKSLIAYAFLQEALKLFPRHAGLWLCMAQILKDMPKYRDQARTAAENAMVCLKEPPQQAPRVTAADVEPVLRSLR